MFRRRITLFKLFGFGVRIHVSWVLIALLVTWSLAEGLFPQQFPELSTSTHWIMGILGALGLFLSIIFHEFCHSLVARKYGLPMKGITLFVFGGIAEMSEEPENPKVEFLMAGVGPVSSLLLALAFYLLWLLGETLAWPDLTRGVIGYLVFINILLAVFNLLPAFPLDGGRILRSTLWYWKKDLRRATSIATRIGSGFGIALLIFGLVNIFAGQFIGGLWYFLIGTFLYNAAKMSYRQLLLTEAFKEKKVSDLMDMYPDTVSTDLSLSHLVEKYFRRRQDKWFPVVDEENQLVGCVSLAQVKKMPRDEWEVRKVADIYGSCPQNVLINPYAGILQALSHLMQQSNTKRLLVVENGKLIGTISLGNILSAFSTWLDLEPDSKGL